MKKSRFRLLFHVLSLLRFSPIFPVTKQKVEENTNKTNTILVTKTIIKQNKTKKKNIVGVFLPVDYSLQIPRPRARH
jgi:hypothetical protein